MRFVTLDFETYYDKEYSLSRMSTEDYVKDPRFEVILLGIKINDDPKYWITGTKKQVKQHLDSLDLEHSMVLGHHMMFDGLVLVIQFGIVCGFYCDTRLLAQAVLRPYIRSVSLDSCLKHIDVGVKKGTAVHNMIGRTRASLSSKELEEYADYCLDDVEGTFQLFKYLAPQFPRDELDIMDMTLRMYLCPVLELDSAMLAEQLQIVIAKKEQAINSLPAGVQKADVMSNPKFAEVLKQHGVEEIPTKISPTTGLASWAFAKTDMAWKNFEEEYADDPVISALIATRMAVKSTLEETRTKRLLDDSLKHRKFRVPLLYYAAHTGRYGGSDGINVQNFPRVTNSKMRYAIRAPKDYVIVAADLAQIECRLTAWLAKQLNLLEGFRNREDIYAAFATKAYRIDTVKDRSPEDKKRRHVGKTCVLGMGFGVGAAKLQAALRKDGVKIDIIEAEMLVRTYRETYARIPVTWRDLDNMIAVMASNNLKYQWGPVVFAKNSVILPNGMALVYENLRRIQTDKYSGWVYDFGGEVRTLWGGKLLENIVQALDFVLIKEYMMKIKHTIGLYIVMQNHDELDYVVHKDHAEKVAKVLKKIMSVPPTWGPDLPVEVDINFGQTFGDCK